MFNNNNNNNSNNNKSYQDISLGGSIQTFQDSWAGRRQRWQPVLRPLQGRLDHHRAQLKVRALLQGERGQVRQSPRGQRTGGGEIQMIEPTTATPTTFLLHLRPTARIWVASPRPRSTLSWWPSCSAPCPIPARPCRRCSRCSRRGASCTSWITWAPRGERLEGAPPPKRLVLVLPT